MYQTTSNAWQHLFQSALFKRVSYTNTGFGQSIPQYQDEQGEAVLQPIPATKKNISNVRVSVYQEWSMWTKSDVQLKINDCVEKDAKMYQIMEVTNWQPSHMEYKLQEIDKLP